MTDTATTIYLIRHAHAHWSTDDNRSLSPEGFTAAHALGEKLRAFPITAIYSSPHQRTIETIAPLAQHLGLSPELIPDLRERELPPAADADDFERVTEKTWLSTNAQIRGGESNAAAQTRAMAVMRQLIERHKNEHIAVSTHGTLLALILNGFDPEYGYQFWRTLSFPDVYQLEHDGALRGVRRISIDGARA